MFGRLFCIVTVFLLCGCSAMEKIGFRSTNVYQIKENKLITPPDMYDCPEPESSDLVVSKPSKKPDSKSNKK